MALRYRGRFINGTRGNVATLAALTAPVLLAAAAFAIDEGALYTEHRRVQALADLAAIAAARSPAKAELAVRTALEDNGVTGIVFHGLGAAPMIPASGQNFVTVEVGRYTASPEVAPGQRFASGATNLNGARVTIERKATRHFAGILRGDPTIRVVATASESATAAFSVGSRLLSLNGGLANAVLGGLTGGSLSLSVMDYEALIDADVSLFPFLDALATELDLTAGTYAELLDSEVAIGKLVDAMAKVDGHGLAARTALARLKSGVAASNRTVRLAGVIDLGDAARLAIGSGSSAISAQAGVMHLVTASAAVASGTNQVALDLGAQFPGLASASVKLAIGDPMQHSAWLAVGEIGEIVRTAQTRLRIEVAVGGAGLLAGTSVKLPIHVEIAFAEARLQDIACASASGHPRVTVAARPGVVDLRIAEAAAAGFADFGTNQTFSAARLVDTPLLKVRGSAQVQIAQPAFQPLAFSRAEINAGAVKTVSTTAVTSSLVTSLVGGLNVDVQVLGLGLTLPSAVSSALGATLQPVTPALDALLADVLALLGVRVGEADIRVNGVRCGRSVLVQ